MVLKGSVLNTKSDSRELVGKDGLKKQVTILYVQMMLGGESPEICLVKHYQEIGREFPLPVVGKDWTTPAIKKYENYNGLSSEALV